MGPNEGVMEGIGSGATHYVSNGLLVEYTAQQKADKKNVPLYSTRWNNTLMAWEDLRDLEKLKADKWAQLKTQRDAAIESPKMTSVGLFDAYPPDQNNLNKVIALVKIAAARGFPDTANYTLATNERVTLTLTQLETAALEMGAQVQAIYDAFDVLRQEVDSATTAAEVAAVAYQS